MSNKRRLAAILGGCLAIVVGVVGFAFFPPVSEAANADGVFHIDVVPQTPVVIDKQSTYKYAIAGQQFVFLVTVTDDGTLSGPVTISARANGATVVIYQQEIVPGQVAEVFVTPEQKSVGKTIKVTIMGTQGKFKDKEVASFIVAEGEDDRGEYAAELLDKFVDWFAANQTDLGITEATAWNGTMVSPVWLVVSHYLFFSDEWEAHIYWHIMIPPYDWARIDLRHRFDELAPSYSFEISSLNATSLPIPIEVPDTAWR
jgi:hypothetical protein